MMTYFSPFLRVCVLVVFAVLVMLLNDDYGATFLVVHGEELGLEKKMTMVEKKKKALLLPTIPNVQSLRSGMHDDIVKRAFFGKNAPGVLFVKGLKGFQEVREKSLRRLAECATSTKKTKKEDEKEDVFLRNSKTYSKEHPEIERSTLAEFANKRLSMDVNGECEDEGEDGFDLRRELEKLRDFADVVSRATLPRLDAILNSNEEEDKTRRPSRMERNFFNDALRSEASLDHFHVYASSEDSSSSSSSEKNVRVNKSEKAQGKHEHTDVGVAIVMTPAWVNGKDDQAGSRGLIVDGVSFDIPSDGMLVLLGEAARAWHPKRHERVSTTNSLLDEIKIPTHAVALERGETRAWFGRMILPNLSDEHPDLNVNLNFGEWLNGARALVNGINGIEDVKETSGASSDVIDYVSAACDGLPTTTTDDESRSRVPQRRILADDGSCAEGTIYCWLSCQPIPTGCDASTAKCQESGTEKIWPDDFGANGAEAHCDSCAPACPAVPNESSGGQCNSNIPPTTMFMDGFSSGTDANQPCVAFFFESWSLKTPALVFAACLFTIFLGMSIELCAKLRRKVRGGGGAGSGKSTRPIDRTTTLLTLLLYAFQVTAGYLLMLVSMTYHVPLFFCVVLGLTLGHAIFSVYSSDGGGKITAGTTACCAEARDDADDTNESDRSNSLEREILRDSGTSTSPTESDGSARV